MEYPLVAIVGAPNAGKSTLFNRLVGRRQAIVAAEPGITRDRLYGTSRRSRRPFHVVDTGGIVPKTDAPYGSEIEFQARIAMEEAEVIVFLVDGRSGPSPTDLDLADLLRRQRRPVVLAANKIDSGKAERELDVEEFRRLGLGEAILVSAEHGHGIGELTDAIERHFPEHDGDDTELPGDEEGVLDIALVGRPNVGKSSLVNKILGQERVVVSERPGTTRDAIDTLFELDGRRYRLIDTAGLRRPGRVREAAERFSTMRTRRTIDRGSVALLVVDGSVELTAQDVHIAGAAREAFKPLVVAVNKWDLVEGREEEAKRWLDRVATRLRFWKETPIVFVSAKSGQRVFELLKRADLVHAQGGIAVPTTALNRWLERHPMTVRGRSRGRGGFRMYYATQAGTHPPRFLIFCNDPKEVHFSLERQLANGLREEFGFGAAPIKLSFRPRRSE